MIAAHIAKLRRVLDEAGDLPESTRTELLRLVQALEADLSGDADPSSDASSSSSESGEDTVLVQLRNSIEELEATHPETAAVISRVATVLANMGI